MTAVLAAQQRPDFSGRWVVVEPASGAGAEQRLMHDLKANTLTFDHDSEGSGHRVIHKLDGTESRNVLASHGSEIVTLSKAQWVGNQITINGVATYPDGRRVDRKEIWSLDSNGQLIVDFTETVNGRTTMTRVVHMRR